MNAQMLLQSFAGGDEEKTYIEDVFSTYHRTGTGADTTVTNGNDMTKGFMLWSKGRSGTTDHAIYDSARGVTFDLASNNTAAQTTQATGLKSVSSDGYTIGSLAKMNTSGATYVDWCFREAPKFFKKAVVTKSAGSNATVDLSSLGTVGMVTVKRTDSTGDWYTWHRSLPAGQLMYLNKTSAAATLGHITVSGTTLTLVNGVIADGSYAVYAWAHDTSPNGLIQCGSFTTDASGKSTANLGWEPQFIKIKASSSTSDWIMLDSMRGMPVGSTDARLYANTSGAEESANTIDPTAVGFNAISLSANTTYIYLAIRRPNKPPKTGAEVYKTVLSNPTTPGTSVTGTGFPPDLNLALVRNGTSISQIMFDRLRGGLKYLSTSATSAEGSVTGNSFLQDGFYYASASDESIANTFFRRAPGFFDVICDTGTGSAHAINHNLTVAPELIIRKSRSASTQWECWHSALAATEKLVLNSTAGKATDATAFGTLPTATQFYVGASANTNASAATYVTYLFATCHGVSKVFSYIGNGSSQTINCGFSGGARFVLIKASSATGSWWIYDTARGIVSSADPALQLNSTVAEISTADAIDPDPSGFIVNQEASCSINANGVSYVGLAIS